MKMILAIINHDDAHSVIQALSHGGFRVTKLATTGGFLMAGNVTVLTCVDDDKVQEVLDIIKKGSHSRKQVIPTTSEMGMGFAPTMPVEVVVGGATVIILNVERFEQI